MSISKTKISKKLFLILVISLATLLCASCASSYDEYRTAYYEGYDEGHRNGSDSGYDTGYDIGFDIGYKEGVHDAATSARSYMYETYGIGDDSIVDYVTDINHRE